MRVLGPLAAGMLVLNFVGLVVASAPNAYAQAGMSMEYLERVVTNQECPTVLEEYDSLRQRDYCPENTIISNETIAEADRCRDEVWRQNMIILKYNTRVRLCRLQAEANQRAAEAEPPPPPPKIYSPSFDCGQASSPTEHAICGSEDLSTQDRSMSAAYRQLRERSPAPDAVRQRQREWVRERDSCGAQESCIGDAYVGRSGEINDEMDMVANDEMHAGQQSFEAEQNFDEQQDAFESSDGDSAASTSSSTTRCTDISAIQEELYNRSCNYGEDHCYYPIVERMMADLGIQCEP